MSNVDEEPNLHELLWEHRKEWPEIEDPVAIERLRDALIRLLRGGDIAVYAERWARVDTRRDLTVDEACLAVRDEANWQEPEKTEWFHYIYAVNQGVPASPRG